MKKETNTSDQRTCWRVNLGEERQEYRLQWMLRKDITKCGCEYVLSVWTVRDENTMDTRHESTSTVMILFSEDRYWQIQSVWWMKNKDSLMDLLSSLSAHGRNSLNVHRLAWFEPMSLKKYKQGEFLRKSLASCMQRNSDSFTRVSRHQDKWQKWLKDVLRHRQTTFSSPWMPM